MSCPVPVSQLNYPKEATLCVTQLESTRLQSPNSACNASWLPASWNAGSGSEIWGGNYCHLSAGIVFPSSGSEVFSKPQCIRAGSESRASVHCLWFGSQSSDWGYHNFGIWRFGLVQCRKRLRFQHRFQNQCRNFKWPAASNRHYKYDWGFGFCSL